MISKEKEEFVELPEEIALYWKKEEKDKAFYELKNDLNDYLDGMKQLLKIANDNKESVIDRQAAKEIILSNEEHILSFIKDINLVEKNDPDRMQSFNKEKDDLEKLSNEVKKFEAENKKTFSVKVSGVIESLQKKLLNLVKKIKAFFGIILKMGKQHKENSNEIKTEIKNNSKNLKNKNNNTLKKIEKYFDTPNKQKKWKDEVIKNIKFVLSEEKIDNKLINKTKLLSDTYDFVKKNHKSFSNKELEKIEKVFQESFDITKKKFREKIHDISNESKKNNEKAYTK